MDTKLLDKTIMEDYSKLEPIVKQNIIKQRPKIKEVILEVSFRRFATLIILLVFTNQSLVINGSLIINLI